MENKKFCNKWRKFKSAAENVYMLNERGENQMHFKFEYSYEKHSHFLYDHYDVFLNMFHCINYKK